MTGALAWRTYMVPGDPSRPFESEALRRAAATWSGEWWKGGGGASPWDPIVYDPDLDLIYVGTANPSPWYPELRGTGRGRQPVRVVDRRAQCPHGRDRVALPNDPW
jgi:glucose dehydrogenase